MAREAGCNDDTVCSGLREHIHLPDESIRVIHAVLCGLLPPLNPEHHRGPLVSNHNPTLEYLGPESPIDEVHVQNHWPPGPKKHHSYTGCVKLVPDGWTWLDSVTGDGTVNPKELTFTPMPSPAMAPVPMHPISDQTEPFSWDSSDPQWSPQSPTREEERDLTASLLDDSPQYKKHCPDMEPKPATDASSAEQGGFFGGSPRFSDSRTRKPKLFQSEESGRRHFETSRLDIEDGMQMYQCDTCPRSFAQLDDNMKQHFRRYHTY